MIHAHKVPSLIQTTFPNYLWKKDIDENIIYITFDDGPIKEITPWVLNELQKYQAKATFFCVGENVKKYPDIFNEVKSAGHLVANHTFHHINGWTSNTLDYLEQVKLCKEVMEDDTLLFRPPYGKIKTKQAKLIREQGYQIVMWSVLSGDYHHALSPENCLKQLIKNTNKGAIVVFHDNVKAKKNLFHALPKFLAYFSAKGYQFKSLC